MTTYLITGGAGSLGREIVQRLTNNTVRVLDIDEAGLSDLKEMYPDTRCLYGDIRDLSRVTLAMKGVDVCIHTAAMKNINVTEYNVPELIHTNVTGTQNLVLSAIEQGVKHFIFMSSDKAVYPTTSYGTTKLLGENIVKWAGKIQNRTKFTIIRPGNFWKSKGNVFEVWEKQAKDGKPLTLTNWMMMRYFIETEKVANMIIGFAGDTQFANTTIIPRMKTYLISEELKKRYPNSEIKITGIRPGEKFVEKLWIDDEKIHVAGDYMEVKW